MASRQQNRTGSAKKDTEVDPSIPTENEPDTAEQAPPAPAEPKDDDLVRIKINVNVWDHKGNKHGKGSETTLQRKQAMQLLEDGKASRIDPLGKI